MSWSAFMTGNSSERLKFSELSDIIPDYDGFADRLFIEHPDLDDIEDKHGYLHSENLHVTYKNVIASFDWCSLENSYKEYLEDPFSRIYSDDILNGNKIFWLFYGARVINFISLLEAFIIKANDLSLTPHDSALLFYISLQDDETKALAELPLPILYDMFEPIAEANLNSWKNA
jgi:hypothetical protein